MVVNLGSLIVQIKKEEVLDPNNSTIARRILNYSSPLFTRLKTIRAAERTVILAIYVNPFL